MNTSVVVDDEAWVSLAGAEEIVKRAVAAALPEASRSVDVLLSNDAEIRKLNKAFRNKDKATNVLSFPAPDMPLPPGEVPHLGDIVLAHETIVREAIAANKTLSAHVTHLVVHATLHLLGLDHETDAEAELMEKKERDILAKLGIADPYST